MSNGNQDGGTPSPGSPADDAGTRNTGSSRDAGTPSDADTPSDAGAPADAGTPDAGPDPVVKRALQLTFDDGPDPVHSALTPILKEIKNRGVIAAFFVIGEEVVKNHSALTTISAAGHVLANHSWNHLEPSTAKYSDEEIYDQFAKTHEEVKSTGVIMEHWRAPRLQTPHRIQEILTTAKLKGKAPLYSKSHNDIQADSRDSQGASSADAMLKSIERDFSDSRIPRLRINGVRVWRLLFHVKPSTASALAEVLDTLQERGGTFVDFSQN
jgi:peptidoglycan/xylan/chitin deacetylase (PgdA/CDA1 family)